MGKNTAIEWTDHSWPVVNGCRRISPGCGGKAGVGGCYAERLISTRLRHLPKYEGLAAFGENGPRWTGKSRLWVPALAEPLKIRQPSKIFVADMGDLFFEEVTNEEIAAVFGVMAAAPQHTFQVLTKRPERMREWFAWATRNGSPHSDCVVDAMRYGAALESPKGKRGLDSHMGPGWPWPLPNVWLGVSVESQQYANERIPHLLATPAAVRFLSCEPLLGPVDLTDLVQPYAAGEHYFNALECDVGPEDDGDWKGATVDWVIVGSESGPGARPMGIEWARGIVGQCRIHDVACFVKQIATDAGRAAGDRKGGDMAHWPADVRIREFPRTT